MHWDKSVVSLDLRVSPSFSIATSEEDAAPYLGRYSFAWVPRPGEKPDTSELVLTWEKGSIYGKFIPKDNYFDGFVMIRLADGSLIPGLFEKGEIYEVIRDMVFEFKGPKARPDHYEVRDDHDELMASGSRKAGLYPLCPGVAGVTSTSRLSTFPSTSDFLAAPQHSSARSEPLSRAVARMVSRSAVSRVVTRSTDEVCPRSSPSAILRIPESRRTIA